jgi:hypothetical protein
MGSTDVDHSVQNMQKTEDDAADHNWNPRTAKRDLITKLIPDGVRKDACCLSYDSFLRHRTLSGLVIADFASRLHRKRKSVVALVAVALAVSTVQAGQLQVIRDEPTVDSSGANDVDTSCHDACLDVMRPVVDENGVQYSNECVMRRAKCKGTKNDVDVLEEYKRLYGKDFGTPRSEDDSASEESGSYGDESASEQDSSSSSATKLVKSSGKVDKSTKTSSASTSGIGSLYEDGSEGVIDEDSAEDSASGSGEVYCVNIQCAAVYNPVTDENGVTYSNECAMNAAKAEKNCKHENPLDAYKRIYGREFGSPRSDEDSASEENDDESASESSSAVKFVKSSKATGKANKSTKTSSAGASDIGSLYEDGSDGLIGSDSAAQATKCASGCPDVELPVCGSNGVTYSNPCELKIAACESPELNLVEDDSACSSSKITTQDETADNADRKIGTTPTLW